MICKHYSPFLALITFLVCHVLFAGQVIRIKSDKAVVLSTPSEDSSVVYTASRGESLKVEREEGDWFFVVLPESAQGWVYGELIKDNIVVVPRVKIRSGPGLQYNPVGELKKGSEVKINGKEGDWLRVSVPFVISGWINKKNIQDFSLPAEKNVDRQTKEITKQSETLTVRSESALPAKTMEDKKKEDVSPSVKLLVTNLFGKVAEEFEKQKHRFIKPREEYSYYCTGIVSRAWWTFGVADYALVSATGTRKNNVLCYLDEKNGEIGRFVGNKVVVGGNLQRRKGVARPFVNVGRIELVGK